MGLGSKLAANVSLRWVKYVPVSWPLTIIRLCRPSYMGIYVVKADFHIQHSNHHHSSRRQAGIINPILQVVGMGSPDGYL